MTGACRFPGHIVGAMLRVGPVGVSGRTRGRAGGRE